MNASDCDSSQGYALDDFENDDSSDDGIENGTKDINVSSLAFNVSSLAIDIGDKDGGEASLNPAHCHQFPHLDPTEGPPANNYG